MKAGLLTATNEINCVEIETPSPAAGEVRVRVACTGVCGSDVPRVLQGRVHGFPLVPGHEFSGRVDAIGAGVDPALMGQRVVGVPLVPCMADECPDCSKGYYSLCKNYSFIGSRTFGSMAEYVCLPERNVLPISDDVSDIEGALFEPATVAVHGIELAKVTPGKSAIVMGCGTIGILLAQALPYYGIDNVVVSIHHASKDAAVRSAGLTNVVATENEGWRQQAREMAGVGDFDYVFDAVGSPATIVDSLSVAANRGTVCFVGTPKRDVVFTPLQWEQINRRELTVIGSWMSYSAPWPGREWDVVRHLFSTGNMKVTDEMIDEVYSLCEIKSAFHRFEEGNVRGKLVIRS
jgi:L-iditol 2-dehydrogenase